MKLTHFNGNKFPPHPYPIPTHPIPSPPHTPSHHIPTLLTWRRPRSNDRETLAALATSPHPFFSFHCHLEHRKEKRNAEHMRSGALVISYSYLFFVLLARVFESRRFLLRVASLLVESLRATNLKVAYT